jgi:putative transposase
VAADLKAIYGAPTAQAGEQALEAFTRKWSGRYPMIAKSWLANWARVIPFFQFPDKIRRVIYTTNAIVLSWWYSFYRRTISIFPSLSLCS